MFIALLHLVGWGTLAAIVMSGGLRADSTAFGIGTGLTAYMLGVRHAFDADHIAAIDNTTRKLLRQGRGAHSVGFWFSCGHSSIVFGLTLLIALGVHALAAPVADKDSLLHYVTGTFGTLVSGSFLYLVAAMNMIILYEIWKAFRQMRNGSCNAEEIESKLSNRGLVNRVLGQTMSLVTKPWQMFAVGTLFGLGFDTATEVSLLVLTGTGVASGLPWYAVLCLPVLFAAGMSLMDTLDSSLMNNAYGWALNDPVRRLYYNLVVTGLSVIAALLIATIEVLVFIAENFAFESGLWQSIASFDLNAAGFLITAMFLITWAFAAGLWKYAGRDMAAASRAHIATENEAIP
jgi:high-affinity nickel-transport protein